MLSIKIKSFESDYSEECIRNIDFNESINSIKKLLDYLGFEVAHTAVKINGEEIHICLNYGELNQDYEIFDEYEIELFLLPDSYDFYEPTLSFLKEDVQIHSKLEVREYNKNYFKFPNEVLNKTTCGNKKAYINRSDRAVDNLVDIWNLVEKLDDNQFKITSKGLRFLENHKGKISRKELQEYNFLEKYRDFKRNLIFFGAPGTGKSYKLNEEVKNVIGENNLNLYERVTFHPEYSYSNFVGTYKPVSEKNDEGKDIISYKFVPGPFLRILKKAIYSKNGPNPEPYFLIIEEINRANFASVFGDVFQLLDRDDNGESEYFIDTSKEMREYLQDTSDMFVEDDEIKVETDDFRKIKIPNNMFIWATMNSADQGVFYMDTAFKRRWDFEHINLNPENILDNEFNLPNSDKPISWNTLRTAINSFLLDEYNLNEDKLIGFYFISNIKNLDDNEFIEAFKNKVIMYLFEDAAKSKTSLFENSTEKTYSKICDDFDEKGIYIFHTDIIREITDENASD